MTRLCTDDVRDIAAQLKEYNSKLQEMTGCTLSQIAAHAAGVAEQRLDDPKAVKIAVIPITNGKGIIKGFTEAVQSIASFLGYSAFITENTDIAGLAEAFEKNAKLVMLADDFKFIAVNVDSKKVVDNAEATAKGYVSALYHMAGGLNEKKVLLLGAGQVGRNAAMALASLGAVISVYDIKQERSKETAFEIEAKFNRQTKIITDLDEALSEHRILFAACPASGFIHAKHISSETLIAAPGIPLAVENQCLPIVSNRLIHDPLQLGVAAMIVETLYRQ